LQLSFPNMNRGLMPRRGLVFSLLTHLLVIGVVLMLPKYFGAATASRTRALEAEDYNPADNAIYLPRLGGGSEGNGHSGGGPLISQKGTVTTPAPTNRGLSDPGPQAILSDPPHPTNTFQTIMRPALKNPPELKTLVRVPNVVKTTDAGPLAGIDSQAPPRPIAPVSQLTFRAPQQRIRKASATSDAVIEDRPPSVDAPTLTLPAYAPQRPSLPELHAPKVATAKTAAPAAPQFSPVPTSGPDDQNLLAISLVPAPPGSPTNLPDGEARGRFAIARDANPASAESQPGSRLQGSATSQAAIGNQPGAAPGNVVSEGRVGTTEGNAQFETGGTVGQGTRNGNSAGAANGGNGTSSDDGRGSASSEGMGSGPGNNPGAGSGEGAGPGSGSFPGVTIGSGRLDPGLAMNMVYPVPVAIISRLRRNTIIVSTGSIGGGGLDAYGVLDCEKIFTIFLPMPGGNWTMQYCVGAGSDAGAAGGPRPSAVVHLQTGLVPPEPETDSRFDFRRVPVPPEKQDKMIILKGTLRDDGTVDALTVYRGVVSEMDEAARTAFAQWKFKPAMRDGKPVPVEILVGIPSEIDSLR
jgi:hypothetical protein